VTNVGKRVTARVAGAADAAARDVVVVRVLTKIATAQARLPVTCLTVRLQPTSRP
jgi:hypothetical protein